MSRFSYPHHVLYFSGSDQCTCILMTHKYRNLQVCHQSNYLPSFPVLSFAFRPGHGVLSFSINQPSFRPEEIYKCLHPPFRDRFSSQCTRLISAKWMCHRFAYFSPIFPETATHLAIQHCQIHVWHRSLIHLCIQPQSKAASRPSHHTLTSFHLQNPHYKHRLWSEWVFPSHAACRFTTHLCTRSHMQKYKYQNHSFFCWRAFADHFLHCINFLLQEECACCLLENVEILQDFLKELY